MGTQLSTLPTSFLSLSSSSTPSFGALVPFTHSPLDPPLSISVFNTRGIILLPVDLMRHFGELFSLHHPLRLLETTLFPPPSPAAPTLQLLTHLTSPPSPVPPATPRFSSSSQTYETSDPMPPLLDDSDDDNLPPLDPSRSSPFPLATLILLNALNHSQTLHTDFPSNPASSTSSHGSEVSESMPALIDDYDDDNLSTADLLTILSIHFPSLGHLLGFNTFVWLIDRGGINYPLQEMLQHALRRNFYIDRLCFALPHRFFDPPRCASVSSLLFTIYQSDVSLLHFCFANWRTAGAAHGLILRLDLPDSCCTLVYHFLFATPPAYLHFLSHSIYTPLAPLHSTVRFFPFFSTLSPHYPFSY